MILKPKTTKDNGFYPDQDAIDQEVLLLEMAKIIEQKDVALEQKDDVVEKKLKSLIR